MPELKTQNNRMGHIDSIRGIAALLVAWLHTSDIFRSLSSVEVNGLVVYELAYRFDFGRIGVITFFAISGFVICPSLKGGKVSGSGKFVISRFLRLYPAFWLAMACAIVILFLLQGREVDEVQVLGNIPMLYSLFNVRPLQGLYWTLEVELVFYFLCLGTFLMGWLHKPLAIIGICLCLLYFQELIHTDRELRQFINTRINPNWNRMPWHLAIMFWGGLFRIWYDDRRGMVAIWRIRAPNLLLVVGMLLLILLRPIVNIDRAIEHGANLEQYRGMLAYILGIMLFLVGALFIRISHPMFVWLGAISYSIYLLHPLAARLLLTVSKRYFPEFSSLHLGVSLLLSLVLTTMMSACVYYLVEKPSIRLGRTLQQKWFAPNRQTKPGLIPT